MAQHDGRITLETKVDTKGIKESEKDIKRAADRAGAGFKNLGNTISKALREGDSKTAQLASGLQKATAEVEKQKAKVDELKAHLAGLEGGSVKVEDKGVSKLQADFDRTNASIEKTQAEINQLYMQLEQLQMNAFKAPDTGETVLTGKEQAEFDRLNAKLDELEPKLEQNRQKAKELGEALRTAAGAGTQAEIDRTKARLSEAETKLQGLQTKAEIAGQKLKTSMAGTNNAVSQVSNGFGRMGVKLTQLARGALVFSAITRGFTMLRQELGAALMSNDGFRNSLYQLQAAFWTAFGPIYDYVLPALQALINCITSVIMAIVKLFAALTGKSMSSMVDNGKALKQQTDAYKALSSGGSKAAKGMKKTTDEAKKQLAAFDELNILTEDKAKEDSGADSGGGVSGGPTGATFDGLKEIDTTQLDVLSEKLQGIALIVGGIAAGLLAWKIYDFITTLMAGGEAAAVLGRQLQTVSGCLLAIAGSILLISGYSDAWVNGIDWANFAMIFGGLALVIAGIALAVSPVAAAFAAIGGAIAVLVLGVKDFIENGPSFQNILTIIIALLVVFAATMYIAGAPVAIVVTAIAALVAVFVMLWNTNEGFRNFWIELWETIKTTAVNVWEEYLKPTLQAIGDFFVGLYNDHIKPTIDFVAEIVTGLWNDHIRPFWEDHLKPAFVEIGSKLSELWTNTVEPIVKWVGEKVQVLWDDYLQPFIDFIVGMFCEDFQNTFSTIGDVFGTFFDTASEIIDSVKDVLSGIIDFINDVFNGNWSDAWEDIKEVFKGVVNGIISLFEGMINFVIDAVNGFLKKINSAVSAVGGLFGQEWDIGLHIEHIKIPGLAQGAVIPPNREFLARLGDNKNEPEIVSPLSTMREAVKEALGEMGYSGGDRPIILELDGREVGRTFGRAIQDEARRTGSNFVKPKIVFG